MKKFLAKSLEENRYYFSAELQEKFAHYLDLLQQWNRVFNLTSIHHEEDRVLLHILDSLAISTHLHGTKIIDIGSGAGLPGIPLALTHSEKNFLLLDSNRKKTRFLTHVMHELNINNLEIVHARCENFHPSQRFDSILSRAFASLKVMLTTTQHLINENGRFLAMKGLYPEEEIQEIPPEFTFIAGHKLIIKGLDAERHLICLEKDQWEKRSP